MQLYTTPRIKIYPYFSTKFDKIEGMDKIKVSGITISKIESGKFKSELPEIYHLQNNIENNPWHKNQTTFFHTILVLKALEKNIKKYQNIKKLFDKNILFLATLFHDIAKPKTRKVNESGWTMFPGHEKLGAEMAKKILKRFDLTKKEINLICEIIKNHDVLHELTNTDPFPLTVVALKEKFKNIYIYLLFLNKSDTEGSNLKELDPENFKRRIEFYDKKAFIVIKKKLFAYNSQGGKL